MFEEKKVKCKDCLWWYSGDEYVPGFCGVPFPMWLSNIEREDWNNAEAESNANKCEAFKERD